MDKVLSTILLVVAAVVCVTLVINAVYPAITSSSGALGSASARMNERIKSQIEIIHATSELDEDGNWTDTNSNGYFDTFVWVKNVGTQSVVDVGRCDVFLEGNATTWAWIPNIQYAEGAFPQWDYDIENGDTWGTATTMRIDISHDDPLSSGEYRVKVLIPNGVSDEYYFSM
jgi:archaellum component FlaG (FlaF/FlaG flagellin family)